MDEDETSDTAWALTTLLIAGVVIAIMLALVREAPAREVCLTKSEARQLWPKRHIYWYSSDHCWSNRRGPPRGIKIDPVPDDPVFPKRAMAKDLQTTSKDNDDCCWPALDHDASGNLVEPPVSFKDRWYEFPSVFVFYRQRMMP
jgi:hypothetical protein